jgi:lysophospholipase L1-like esterase
MRALVLAVALGLACAAGLGAPGGAAPQSQAVLNYGDSLAVGTGIYLPGFLHGWSVSQSGTVSKHTAEVPVDLRRLGAGLPRVVVVSAGANDDPRAVSRFAAHIRETLHIAGGDRCVVWANVVRPPYAGVSYDGLNRVLALADRASRTLRVFDRAGLAHAHAEWFTKDGVHPTAAGYRARAAAVAQLVRTC